MLELMLHPVNAREKPQGGGVLFWASLNTESKKNPSRLFYSFLWFGKSNNKSDNSLVITKKACESFSSSKRVVRLVGLR